MLSERTVSAHERTPCALPLPLPLPVPKPLPLTSAEKKNESLCDSPISQKPQNGITPRNLYDFFVNNNKRLPSVKAFTTERQKHCRARCATFNATGDPDKAFAEWCNAITIAQDTPFLRGEGEQGWKATFDWFIRNGTNYVKVLEGKYVDANENQPDAAERYEMRMKAEREEAND